VLFVSKRNSQSDDQIFQLRINFPGQIAPGLFQAGEPGENLGFLGRGINLPTKQNRGANFQHPTKLVEKRQGEQPGRE